MCLLFSFHSFSLFLTFLSILSLFQISFILYNSSFLISFFFILSLSFSPFFHSFSFPFLQLPFFSLHTFCQIAIQLVCFPQPFFFSFHSAFHSFLWFYHGPATSEQTLCAGQPVDHATTVDWNLKQLLSEDADVCVSTRTFTFVSRQPAKNFKEMTSTGQDREQSVS